MKDVLAALAREYARVRAELDRSAPAVSSLPPNTCRYCGKHWRQWFGSKLDGHAACSVTPEFIELANQAYAQPGVTGKRLADALGVSLAVLRSWTSPMRDRLNADPYRLQRAAERRRA